MGIDEALLAGAGAGVATLRLYRWDGPWLSLGYAQTVTPARVEACRAAGVGLVRRVSGGGAVLHGADLTYALAAPEDWLPPGLGASYARVTDALLAALDDLGVEAERAGGEGAAPRAPRPFDCFVAAGQEEIRAAGRKLVGSAQRRAVGAVLQHGSIRLAPDPPDAARAAGLDPASSVSLDQLAAGLSVAALVEALVRAFGDTLGATLEPRPLAPAERAEAAARARRHAADPLAPPDLAPSTGAHDPASRPPLDRR
jgi:lipoate-protein ligase A